MDEPVSVKRARLQAEKSQLERIVALKHNYGINFYRPHYKQHRFHEVGDVIGRFCRMGNRTGKTKCGAAETVAWCIGQRTWYKNTFDILNGKKEVVGHHTGATNHPLLTRGIPGFPVKGLLVCVSWGKVKEIFTNREGSYDNLGDLFQLIPTESIGKFRLSGERGDFIEIKRLNEAGGGSSLLYIDTVESFKHSSLSAESSDFDFIHYDEPPPRDMFIANKRGLTDRNGKFWINATPVTEQWVNDEEFSPSRGTNFKIPPEGHRFQKTIKGGDRFIITASTDDNPYLSPEGRAEFESSLTAQERECRLHGLPLHLAGLIYKEFQWDLHVLTEVPKGWQDYHLPPIDYTVREAWDVHDAIPQAVLLVATAPNGEVFVYDEMFDNVLIKETAEELKQKHWTLVKGKDGKLVKAQRWVADSLIDPRAIDNSPVTGSSILDVLMEHDLFFDPGSKDMELGISVVREILKQRQAVNQTKPVIHFSPNVVVMLREMTHYCYNPKTMKPIDKNDHMVENLRRLVINGLEYVAPPADDEYKPRVRKDDFSHLLSEKRVIARRRVV